MKGNSISIKGRVASDYEERRSQSGRVLAKWSVCYNERVKNRETDEWEDKGHFFDCKCWMSDAQARSILPQLAKGNVCTIVNGHLEQERWHTDDGNRSKVVIYVDDPFQGMTLTGDRLAGDIEDGYDEQPAEQQADTSVYDDDIPF